MAKVVVNKGPIIGVVGVLAVAGGLLFAKNQGLLDPSDSGPAAVPEVEAIPELKDSPQVRQGTVQVAIPAKAPASVSAPEIRHQEMAWNSQTGLNFANGGIKTTKGSLMEKYGVNLKIVWEDDVNKQATALIAFAKAFKGGEAHPTEGAHFMAVMGDGSAATIGSMVSELRDIGVDPEVIGSAGYSRGEDQLMGPPDWKKNPKLARGSIISTFLRDGDWAIVMKWAADNALKVNPDEKTWDPDAINWYSAEDYIKAADAYIEGICEDRPVVNNGKRTGEKKNVCVNAVSTWTPGDVNIAEKKGGLATIVSTREYRSQMPNTIIGIKQWNEKNEDLVVRFLAATFEGGEAVKNSPEALTRGAEANSEIWGGQKPASYWEKYFKGVTTTDIQGVEVRLGGSSVNNLQDNLALYGLLPGHANTFAATYMVFGNIVKQQYPKLVPDLLPVEKVLNTRYVQKVQEKYGTALSGEADMPKFQASAPIKQVVAKRAWAINFDTGKATFTGDSLSQLEDLMNGLLIAGDLAIEIHGHTDNTGDPNRNRTLSQSRANAVKTWLMGQNSSDFNSDRFLKVEGHGPDVPVATNDTDTGRAKNRRVEVVMGSQ